MSELDASSPDSLSICVDKSTIEALGTSKFALQFDGMGEHDPILVLSVQS